MTWKKTIILGLLLVAPLALAQCGAGNGESVASLTAGPSAPTVPSGYQFDMTVTPHSVHSDSSVAVTVRVWDRNGNMAGGVNVMIVGGDSSSPSATVPTDASGIARFVFTVKQVSGSGTGTAGGVLPITATLENGLLTVPVQVIPVIATPAGA